MDSSASGIPLKKDSTYKCQFKAHTSNIALTRDAWEKRKDKIHDASDFIENTGT